MAAPANRPKDIAVVIAVALIGLGFAWAAAGDGARVGSLSVFFMCGLIAFGVNWLVYIPSAIARTETFYDLTGAITYLSVIATALLLSPAPDLRALVAAAMVALWCTRLGLFLFTRVRRDGEDRRFRHIKVNWSSFLVAWTTQGLWVVLTAASALAIITASRRAAPDAFLYVGAAVWLAGFLIEVVADGQKKAFRADPANREKFITTGLWAWSQHPNYFGEIMLWTGMTIMAIPVLDGLQWMALVSPVFVFLLLTRISGVPLLRRQAKTRWGEDPAFQAYVRSTPILFPRPPRRKGAAAQPG